MRRLLAIVAVFVASTLVVGCSSGAAPMPLAAPTVQLSVEDAWVRTTTGAKDPSMTAAFMTIVNPGEAAVQLTSAECPGAGIVQLHEMVMQNGKMAMQEVKGGVPIPAGSHTHLAPGGFHVMLMKLQQDFAVGDQVTLTLHFSDGGSLDIQAPVKEFVEEEDHYHSPMPTTTASS